jgi:hypothetical protein
MPPPSLVNPSGPFGFEATNIYKTPKNYQGQHNEGIALKGEG